MKEDVTLHFDAFIRDTFKPKPEVMQFLLKHERKALCIERLCEQIEMAQRKKLAITWDVEVYKSTIRSVARMFCDNALTFHVEQNLSSNERIRRQTEANKAHDIEGQLAQWKKDGDIIEIDRSKELGADNGPSQEVQGSDRT